MGSLSGLYIGTSGLRVNQAAINVTSHNLANVDTKGFVRQQAVLSDFKYIKLGESYMAPMQQGLGANFAAVKQVRDVFLDQAYRRETGRQAFYESQYIAVNEVEGLFGELEGVPFQDTIESFWVSLQEMVKEPDKMVTRASLVETAVTFIERAERIAQQLNNYQVNLNTKIQDQVDRINEIGDEIKTLSTKIRLIESTGVERANDLRDQRNLLLDELGHLADITYKEYMDGTITVNLEGVSFISEDIVSKIATVRVSETSDMLKPVWPTLGNMDVFNLDRAPSSQNNTDIGQLKGLLIARGYKQANYTDIPRSEDFTSENLYQMQVNHYNNDINPSVIMTIQAQFDQLIHGVVTTINNVLCPNREVTLSDGSKIWILDEERAPVGMDENKTMGEALFNRKSMDRYSEYTDLLVEDGMGGYETIVARIYNQEDPSDNYSLFTLGEIEVNKNILHNNSLIPLSQNSGSGDYDIEIAQKLLDKWKEPFATLSPNTLTRNSFSSYYTSLMSELANRGEQLRIVSDNQASMVGSIENQRMNVQGVSSDEELTNLIKYQHAYNASARYVNVVNEMLEHIVTRM